MKRIHTPQNVAHLFANQLQSEAYTQGRNLYFENDKIFSYGSHFCIAKHINGSVLFTERGYSNTTAKHINVVWQALNHKNIIYCAYPTGTHEQNFDYWTNDANHFIGKLKNARKPEIYINELNTISNKAKKYAEFFEIEIPLTLSTALAITNKDEVLQYMESKAKILKAEQERKRKEQAKAHKIELKKWRAFEKSRLYTRIDVDYLRKDVENFETSQGVKIPLAIGLRFYNNLKNGSVNVGDTFLSYTINEITKSYIKIGCHKITFKEIETIVK